MLTQMPSLDEFNQTIDQLLQSLKYLKFHKFILDLIVKILKNIWNLFEPLFAGNASGLNAGQKAILVLIVIVVVMITISFILLFIVRRNRKKKVKTILGETISKSSTVASFLEKSKNYEEQKEYRQATRLRFVAILFYLHQNHYLYHDSSMTGQEMIDKLTKEQFKAIVNFEKITNMFNTTWYGMDEIDEILYEKWCTFETDFWREVGK